MKTTKSIFSKNTIRGGVFACIAILAASLIFSSCDNFLKANDVSQEIKEAIAYNNAEACTIVLKADPEMGEFLTGNQITAREGFSSQFQFSLNQDNYIFEEFQALCNSDSTISRADCVEFTEVKKDSKGIYKVTFKLIKKADDIVIRPKCIALPKITEITPKSESGSCDQDTPIKISFNKPVNPDSFFDSTVTAENRTIKNFKGISIYFDEEDLLEHFETPYFSSDNKTLYIPINQDKLILPPDESKNFLNIKVAYNFEEATDCEGYAINQSGIHEYKINKNFGNQKKVMVNIHSEEKYGTILSGSEKECTVGYTIEIQYKPNLEDYKFTGFEAVSIKNNSESRASAVTFEKALLEEQTGFYSVRVRVVEEADDLLLLPVCYEYPKILSYSPDSSHENYANTPIQVNFSIPMEAADTTEENSVFNYDNILLTANGNSVVKYFETPVFDSEKKVLTLPLKGRGLADYLNDTHLSTVTINVTFTERILITKNDVSVGLKNNGKTSFAVLYNKIVETVPPEKLAFEVTSQKINLQNAQEVLNAKKKVVLADKTTLASSTEEVFIDNKFTDKDVATGEGIIQSEYDKAVWQNITTGTVYIYGSYSDTGSGVKSVSVTEQFTYYSDGDPEGSSSDSVTTEYTEKSDNAVFETNNGITKFCIEYKIKEWNDGAISLKVLVKDACGNCSKQEKRDAIKVSRVAGVSISNGSGRGNQSTEYLDFSSKPYYFNTTEHKEAIKKITCQVYDDSDIRASRIFREVIFPVDSYSITCEYDGLQEPVLLEDPEVTKYGWGVTCDWVHELEVESVEGLSVKFTIKDVLGNVLETEKKYPVSDVKINLFKHTNGNICFVLTDSSNKKIGSSSGYFFVAKKGSNEYCWPYDASSEYNNILKSGYEYRIYNSQLGFYGPILNENDPFSCGDYEEPTLRELTVKRKYIEKGTQDGYVVRVVELNDSWKDYDFIYAVRVNGDNQPFDFKDGVLKKAYKADACFAPKYEPGTTDYINSSARIKVYGVKDNIRSPEYEWELPYITDEQKIDYDDIPATIGISNVRNDYLKFSVSDSLSGPLFGKISVPDNVYSEVKTTEAEPFEILLPVWEYMPMSGILYSIAYEVKDKSETGNKKEGLYSSSQFIPIININLLKINTDGSLVIDVDNLYPQYDNPPCEFFVSKLGQEDNNEWQSIKREDYLISDYLTLDDYLLIKSSSDNQIRYDNNTVKDLLALYGIQGDVLGRPEIYSYSFNQRPAGFNNWQSYADALINAGVPAEAIRMDTNYFGLNWFQIPENKTLEEFYNILTSQSGILKFPVNKLKVRLPITNSAIIPRNPYKSIVITDKDLLRSKYNNCFVKIMADTFGGGYIRSRSIYLYVGDSGSGDYDWLMQKSDTDNYLLVSSDAPVYVHTLVTQQPYETCKNWSVDEWEYFKENYNDKYFDFDSTDHFPRRYTIPLDKISSGSSYIVIAHFADNHVETSKVFVKP